MAIFALIPAAGSGTRFARSGSGVPKQYLPVAGRPILWHAVRSVCLASVETVFVVLSPEDPFFASQDWSAFGKLEPLYCGGATRADSVRNGLIAAMSVVEPDDWVLVHDAARPCLPADDLLRLLAACSGDAIGGVLALPVADTVKRATKDEAGTQRIAGTEDRTQLWLAQTPQMFRARMLAEALRRAAQSTDAAAITDEAAAIERLGLRPRLVAGSRDNLKITYPEDLAIAAAVLARQAPQEAA